MSFTDNENIEVLRMPQPNDTPGNFDTCWERHVVSNNGDPN